MIDSSIQDTVLSVLLQLYQVSAQLASYLIVFVQTSTSVLIQITMVLAHMLKCGFNSFQQLVLTAAPVISEYYDTVSVEVYQNSLSVLHKLEATIWYVIPSSDALHEHGLGFIALHWQLTAAITVVVMFTATCLNSSLRSGSRKNATKCALQQSTTNATSAADDEGESLSEQLSGDPIRTEVFEEESKSYDSENGESVEVEPYEEHETMVNTETRVNNRESNITEAPPGESIELMPRSTICTVKPSDSFKTTTETVPQVPNQRSQADSGLNVFSQSANSLHHDAVRNLVPNIAQVSSRSAALEPYLVPETRTFVSNNESETESKDEGDKSQGCESRTEMNTLVPSLDSDTNLKPRSLEYFRTTKDPTRHKVWQFFETSKKLEEPPVPRSVPTVENQTNLTETPLNPENSLKRPTPANEFQATTETKRFKSSSSCAERSKSFPSLPPRNFANRICTKKTRGITQT